MIKILKKIYWRYFKSPEEYARHIGVCVGDNSLMGYNHWSSEPYLITVGSNCQLSDCLIHTHGGARVARNKYPDFDVFGKVKIGDGVYIGKKVQILPGVTIGDGALIAAGSVVTKSVAPRTVVGGNPAKYICTVDEFIDRNLKYNVNSKKMTMEEKKKFLLSLPEDKFLKK